MVHFEGNLNKIKFMVQLNKNNLTGVTIIHNDNYLALYHLIVEHISHALQLKPNAINFLSSHRLLFDLTRALLPRNNRHQQFIIKRTSPLT